MFKLIKKILSFVFTIVFVLAGVACISQFAVNPKSSKVVEKFDSLKNVEAMPFDAEESPFASIMEFMLGDNGVTEVVTIVDGRAPFQQVFSFVIYFDSFKAARDGTKELKDVFDGGSLKISYRGKTAFVGSKEVHKEYREILF